jgi:hypothetical protein
MESLPLTARHDAASCRTPGWQKREDRLLEA